jgi:DNA-binding transcriptional LysR family regulator
VVAAPAFLDDHGRPRTPKDLLGAPCITTRFPSRAVVPWEFEKSGRKIKIQPSDRLSGANTAMQRRAAEDGVGFYLTFEDYVASAVAAGTLEIVLDDWCPSFPGPFLYYPSRRQNPSCLTAFVAFIKEWRTQRRSLRRR